MYQALLSHYNYTSFTTIQTLQSVGECNTVTNSTQLEQVPSYSGLFPIIYMHHEHPLVGYIILPFAAHFIHDS